MVAAEALLELAKKTDIPILTTMNAVDLVQDEMKLGFIGVYGNRVANMIVAASDLIIAIGARLGLRQIGNVREYFAPKAKLIRADIDQYELGRTIKNDEEKYLVDAKAFIESLAAEDIPLYTGWKNVCFEAKRLLEDFDREVGNLCIEKISSLLPSDPVVAVDVGQNLCWAAQSFAFKGQRGRLLIGGSYGSMGCGLPYAIGASIANDKGIVYCITGDGGLQMNIQELETVAREQLPIKIFVLNNHVLGKISEIQAGSYRGRFAQTTKESGYTVPDFKRISEAYGIRGAELQSYENLDEYSDWLKDTKPCLIDINLPTDSKLIPKVIWNTNTIQPEIDAEVEMKVNLLLELGGGSKLRENRWFLRGTIVAFADIPDRRVAA